MNLTLKSMLLRRSALLSATVATPRRSIEKVNGKKLSNPTLRRFKNVTEENIKYILWYRG